MMKMILFTFVSCLFFSVNGHAQSCPASISGSIHLGQEIAGWTAKSDLRDFELQRLSIIDGPLSQNPAEPDAELKPMQKSGVQYWAFGEPIGGREMWMRCEYAHSTFSLSRRISADKALCFQREEPAGSSVRKVVAMCVDSSHKANATLKPYVAH